jgi:hypothetical protein
MGRTCSTDEKKEGFTQGFGGKSEGKRLSRRLRRRWENNIKINLKKSIGSEWIPFIWLRTGKIGRLL